jgi:hypothetical protein
MFLAIAISMVGCFSSSGAALLIATADNGRRANVANATNDADSEVKEAQDAVATWQSRLALVPADYTTQLRTVSDKLAAAQTTLRDARAARQRAMSSAASVASLQSSSPMFNLIAQRLHSEESTVTLVFLVCVSLLLQTSALATTYHANKGVDMKGKQKPPAWWIDQQGVEHLDNGGGGVVCGKPMRYMSAPLPKRDYVMCSVCAKKGVVK